MDPGPGHANQMPTTRGQTALWYADQKVVTSAGYNVTVVWTITREVAASEIAEAWIRIHRETPALAVRMGLDRAGAVVQWLSSKDLDQEYADFQAFPDGAAKAAAFLADRTSQPFDTDGGALARLVVARVRGDISVVTLVAHHLVLDAVSQVSLARKFVDILQPVGEQSWNQPYAELVDAVIQAESRTREADVEYWAERVAGFLEGPDWFTARPTQDLGTRAGYRRGEVVGEGLASLLAAAHDFGVGLYMLVTAAVHRALASAGAERTVVCSAVSVRPGAGRSDDVVGCFINMVPLAARHVSGEALGELVRRESAGWRKDHRHRGLALLDIAGTAGPASTSPNRLDRVFFSYRETDPTLTWADHGPDFSAQLFNKYPATRNDLTLRFFRGSDRLHYEVEWSAATPWGVVFADALEDSLRNPER